MLGIKNVDGHKYCWSIRYFINHIESQQYMKICLTQWYDQSKMDIVTDN
jgi:hypothetical protein